MIYMVYNYSIEEDDMPADQLIRELEREISRNSRTPSLTETKGMLIDK
jgi:hypothetical protein